MLRRIWEVLFSMICRVFGFSPCLQNSITGLVVSRMYFGLSPVKLTLCWSWVTWLSFNGSAELVFQLKTWSSLAFSNSWEVQSHSLTHHFGCQVPFSTCKLNCLENHVWSRCRSWTWCRYPQIFPIVPNVALWQKLLLVCLEHWQARTFDCICVKWCRFQDSIDIDSYR